MMMSFNFIGAIAVGNQSPWVIAGSTQRIASQTFAGKRGSPLMMLSFTIIGAIRMELRMIAMIDRLKLQQAIADRWWRPITILI